MSTHPTAHDWARAASTPSSPRRHRPSSPEEAEALPREGAIADGPSRDRRRAAAALRGERPRQAIVTRTSRRRAPLRQRPMRAAWALSPVNNHCRARARTDPRLRPAAAAWSATQRDRRPRRSRCSPRSPFMRRGRCSPPAPIDAAAQLPACLPPRLCAPDQGSASAQLGRRRMPTQHGVGSTDGRAGPRRAVEPPSIDVVAVGVPRAAAVSRSTASSGAGLAGGRAAADQAPLGRAPLPPTAAPALESGR